MKNADVRNRGSESASRIGGNQDTLYILALAHSFFGKPARSPHQVRGRFFRDVRSPPEHPMPARAFVFDAYGTLFDVHAAVARHHDAAGPEADRFSETWRIKQLEYAWLLSAAGQYLDFWTLTERALDYAFARFPTVDRALRSALLECYFKLDPFADARAALAALKTRGVRTAILSNGSPKMLDAAVANAGLAGELDAVLSVDAIRIYKPRAEVYALATAAFGLAPADVAFISSNRWDVMGATAFGFTCIWINRANAPEEYPEFAPVRVVQSLSALATLDL
jgi:2-haloacid dehalogenase